MKQSLFTKHRKLRLRKDRKQGLISIGWWKYFLNPLEDRQGKRTDIVEIFPPSDRGKTRDKVAEKVGFGSGRTYDKAKKVWDSAKDGAPEAKKEVKPVNDIDLNAVLDGWNDSV